YEIDFERIQGTPLKLGALGWAMSVALAYGIGGGLALAGVVVSFLYTGSAPAATPIGTLIPILQDSGGLQSRFGAYLLAAAGGRRRRVRPDPSRHPRADARQPPARGGDPDRLRRPRAGGGARLGPPRLARLARLRKNLRGEQPARRADHRRPRLRPGAAGEQA